MTKFEKDAFLAYIEKSCWKLWDLFVDLNYEQLPTEIVHDDFVFIIQHMKTLVNRLISFLKEENKIDD